MAQAFKNLAAAIVLCVFALIILTLPALLLG